MSDLSHRLRESAKATFYDPLKSELNEAASHIEKLEEEIGVLIAASIRLSSRIDLDSDGYVDRIEKLEAARNGAYTERNRLVAFLTSIYPSGVRKTAIPGWDEAWHGCVYIDLPTGQASWHFHDSEAHLFAHLTPYDGEWDGHTTEEKYERLFFAANHAKQTDELLADYMKFANSLMPHTKKQNDRIEKLEAALDRYRCNCVPGIEESVRKALEGKDD
jgi:hypothetical protein